MNYTNNDLARRIATAFRVLAGYVMIATAATLLQFYESDTLIIVFWAPAAVAAAVLTLGRFDSVDIEMTQAHTTIRFRQLTWRGYRHCKIVARNEHIVRARCHSGLMGWGAYLSLTVLTDRGPARFPTVGLGGVKAKARKRLATLLAKIEQENKHNRPTCKQ